MTRIYCYILGMALIVVSACSSTDTTVDTEEMLEQTEEALTASENEVEESLGEVPQPQPPVRRPAQAPAATQTQPQQASQPPVVTTPPRQQTAPAPPSEQFATISAGTVIPVRIQDPLDTSINQSGDTFSAIIDVDIMVGNDVVIPRGSKVDGKLTHVARSGRVQGVAAMSMQLIGLHVGSRTYPIVSEILAFEAESTKKEDATKVGIGSGIGAVIGAIAGGGKGAAVGAAVGAGAGGATVAATRGDELKYGVEHPFEFTLDEEVRIQVR